MFDHHDPFGRHINDLPSFDLQTFYAVQRVLTGATDLDRMPNDLIGGLRQMQGAAQMTRLPAGFLAARLTQALRLALEPIRGGRQVTIMAILGEAFLHELSLGAEGFHLLLHRRYQLLLQHELFLLQAQLLLLQADGFSLLLRQLKQDVLLILQLSEVFFKAHALPVLAMGGFCKASTAVPGKIEPSASRMKDIRSASLGLHPSGHRCRTPE